MIEKKYQEELNRAFGSLSEGAFKGLRRQLPITRQKIEWDKVSGYRVSVLFLPKVVEMEGLLMSTIAWAGYQWWKAEVVFVP